MLDVTPAFWKGRRVFLTGHTGFKGSWLTFWLLRMGAVVSGYALAPETTPSLFRLLELPEGRIADLRDARCVAESMQETRPEVVFHLGAQALVRRSFAQPLESFSTNVIGTANVLDAVRHSSTAKAVVVVTSDKCYLNNEWVWPYRETDALGGHDPYSASKAAAEIVTNSMRLSFFAPHRPDGHPARIATVRAGNVIGGGDWSEDRLVPDIVRASMNGESLRLRRPESVRPWQHVLEPLASYLAIAERLHSNDELADGAFNIGPVSSDVRPVHEVADEFVAALGARLTYEKTTATLHEANMLLLDSSKASRVLGWRPRWGFDDAIRMTAAWYAGYARGENPVELTSSQIDTFVNDSPYNV